MSTTTTNIITTLVVLLANKCDAVSLSNKDQVAALLLQSLQLADHLYVLNESLRNCPGAYWRCDPDVAARMEAKRPKRDLSGAHECGSTDKTRSFSQGYLGPAMQGGRRMPLCNTCGAKYHRDAGNEFVSK
jgi:hypothetical protein